MQLRTQSAMNICVLNHTALHKSNVDPFTHQVVLTLEGAGSIVRQVTIATLYLLTWKGIFFCFLIVSLYLLSLLVEFSHRTYDNRVLNSASAGAAVTIDKCMPQLGWGKSNVAWTLCCLAYGGDTYSATWTRSHTFKQIWHKITSIQIAPQMVTHVPLTMCHWTVKSSENEIQFSVWQIAFLGPQWNWVEMGDACKLLFPCNGFKDVLGFCLMSSWWEGSKSVSLGVFPDHVLHLKSIILSFGFSIL